MLSLFPQILFLSPFAALAIRLAIAIYLALSAWQHMAHRDTLTRTLSVVEVAVAVALLVGAWTQIAALIGFVVVAAGLAYPKMRHYPMTTVILMCVMLASLVVTGPGAFAFDLPL